LARSPVSHCAPPIPSSDFCPQVACWSLSLRSLAHGVATTFGALRPESGANCEGVAASGAGATAGLSSSVRLTSRNRGHSQQILENQSSSLYASKRRSSTLCLTSLLKLTLGVRHGCLTYAAAGGEELRDSGPQENGEERRRGFLLLHRESTGRIKRCVPFSPPFHPCRFQGQGRR
jgi:hypothetical protein